MSVRRSVLLFALGLSGSLAVTLGWGIVLKPDVSLYVDSGLGLYPSPLGALVGTVGGVGALAVVHGLAVGFLVVWLARRRQGVTGLLVASPLLFWLVPLGVDAVAALLLVVAVERPGARWWSWIAAGFHLAALPAAVALAALSNRRLAAGALGVGLLVLVVTPYGAAVTSSGAAYFAGLPRATVALLLAAAPLLFVRGLGRKGSELVALAAGTAAVVVYAASAHVVSGESLALSLFTTTRYALPLTLALLLVGTGSYGRAERPKTAPGKVEPMLLRTSAKTFGLLVVVAALGALVLVPSAFAVTVPAIPVSDYGSSLLTSLASAIGQIFPYAAAITAFAIGVGMVKRWLGHRKATRV